MLSDIFTYAISIHAPSRERLGAIQGRAAAGNFNPRSLAGATLFCSQVEHNRHYFNPRSLAGATEGYIAVTGSHNFNPRSLAGATLPAMLPSVPVFAISIHAPSRERPLSRSNGAPMHHHFNPRSLAGATRSMRTLYCASTFQSTLPRGSDGAPYIGSIINVYFNPRSLAGATP